MRGVATRPTFGAWSGATYDTSGCTVGRSGPDHRHPLHPRLPLPSTATASSTCAASTWLAIVHFIVTYVPAALCATVPAFTASAEPSSIAIVDIVGDRFDSRTAAVNRCWPGWKA